MQEGIIVDSIPITPIFIEGNTGVGLDMLRLDLIHPAISGNKWFKLKYNLLYAKEYRYKSVLSFGGAYSNHLIATATAARLFGLHSVGIVRGLYAQERLTPTLQACKDMGMDLQFVSREAYDKKGDAKWLETLRSKYNNPYVIPEGGNNALGIRGSEEIANYIPEGYTHVTVSVGTGTTFTGLRNMLEERILLLGFVPMKGGSYMVDEIDPNKDNWKLIDEYHFGGFGKWSDELIGFVNAFYKINEIPLDMIYTAKMLYGLQQMIQNDHFESGSKILSIHTGGLQGNLSVTDKLCFKIPR